MVPPCGALLKLRVSRWRRCSCWAAPPSEGMLRFTLCGRLPVMQIDGSFASWRDCFSVAWVSGATGHGLGRVLKRVTQLIPKWSLELGSKELNAWRRKMAVALAGTVSVSAVVCWTRGQGCLHEASAHSVSILATRSSCNFWRQHIPQRNPVVLM